MSRTHRVSLIPNGHNVWTIQIEYGISTILYGSYRPKMTFFRPRIEFVGTRNILLMSVLTYTHRKCHSKMSWQYTATSYREGYSHLVP